MHDIPLILTEQDRPSSCATRMVARVLLDCASGSTTGRGRLAQRDMAALTGTDWGTVHMALKSLKDEGAIRIERHRIILNKESLQKVAGVD
jgi:DNA-binding GntR family transcriptional regulator